ncbi:hypothetical protein ACFX11_008551 [Malus domestica]
MLIIISTGFSVPRVSLIESGHLEQSQHH